MARSDQNESADLTDGVLHHISGILIVTDSSGIIQKVNQAALNLLGFSKAELLGQSISALVAPEQRQIFAGEKWNRLLQEGSLRDDQLIYIAKSAERIAVRFTGWAGSDPEAAAVNVVSLSRDIREILELQKRAQALEEIARQVLQEQSKTVEQAYDKLKVTNSQLLQADKMAAVGQLAGSVAHELNNPLTGILGVADILLSEVPADSPWREDLGVLKNAALRCKQIINDLLGFSRQQEFHLQPMALENVLAGTLKLCAPQLSLAKIEIVKSFAENLPEVEVSLTQMQQVFINLIMNARDAMPSGGRLTLSTFSMNPAEVSARLLDAGESMSNEHLSKIFEPFVTTKAIGKGTGLGLSVIRKIVADHKGRIEVHSEGKGKGTAFTVTLPALKKGNP